MILENPLKEVQRIADELTSKCGVPAPPNRLTQEDVDKFIDPNLEHNKKVRELEDEEMKILEEHEGGCVVHDFPSDFLENSPERKQELDMYKKAMKVFCDFKSGKAYEQGYEWPELK
jgi:hypothetical protein